MADSLNASEEGLRIIDLARRKKGCTKDSTAWIDAAKTSRSTLQRFTSGKPIQQATFISICKAVGIDNWEEIVDDSLSLPKASTLPRSVDNHETWVGREELITQLSDQLRGLCRILILTGITGIGKTALAERIALKLQADWPQLIKVNFEDGTPQDFGGFADALLTQLRETVTADDRNKPELLLNHLVDQLREKRYLVQIDSLELLLQGKTDKAARNEFEDQLWWEFFNRLIAGQDCQSRLILTSQDLPTQFISCKYRQCWGERQLSGLETAELSKLFQKLFQREAKTIEPEVEAYLEQIGKVYEGHPLVIEVIAGEILDHPFNGNVVAYWQRYHQEFENVVSATSSQLLELRVKDRVRDTLTRLKQDVTAAYTLLLRSSVYRRTAPESLWLEMLGDITSKEKTAALETLRCRRLVIEEGVTSTGELQLRQHHLIRSVAYELLEETEKTAGHIIAADKWRTAYTPELDASDLEKVLGYLEAFHHLCEVEDWQEAFTILCTRVNTPTNEELHQQLKTWGYYHKRAEVYSKMLGKLTIRLNFNLLHDLGDTHRLLAEYPQAIEYYHQALVIAQEIQDFQLQIVALEDLGIVYHYALRNYSQAIKYHEQSLSIAHNIKDKLGEATVLSNLAQAYTSLKEYSKAIDYHEQSLTLARELQAPLWEASVLNGLGRVFNSLGNYESAIKYHLQSLAIFEQTNNDSGVVSVLGMLGSTSCTKKDYAKAIDYQQKSLNIARAIHDRQGETTALSGLAGVYSSLKNYDLTVKYYDQALAIATQLGIPEAKDLQELKEKLLSEEG